MMYKPISIISLLMTLVALAFADSGRKLFFQDHSPRGDVQLRVGETFMMDCEAGGSPSPTIHWLFNGQRIPNREVSVL